MSYPVIYAPGGQEIGRASTEAGAKRHVRNVPKLACERWTASLRERLDGTKAWFIGPQLTRR